MTVITETRQVVYTSDGVQTTFAYQFKILSDDHMLAYLDGVLIPTAEYTVDGVGEDYGGNVIFTPAPAPGTLALVREVPITQLTDYEPYDPFPADTHEDALDKLTMICQQIWSWIVGSVQKLTQKGDILTVDENGLIQAQRVGPNGSIPVADSAHPYGWAWKDLGLEDGLMVAYQNHFSAMDWQPDNFTQVSGVMAPSIQRHTPGFINCMRFPAPNSGNRYRAFLNRGLSIRLENIRSTAYEVLVYAAPAVAPGTLGESVPILAEVWYEAGQRLNITIPSQGESNDAVGIMDDPDVVTLVPIDVATQTTDPVSFVIPIQPGAENPWTEVLISLSREHDATGAQGDLDMFYAIVRPLSASVPPPENGPVPIQFSAGGWADDDETTSGIITAEKVQREKLIVAEFPNSVATRVSDGASGDRRIWFNGAQGIRLQGHRTWGYDVYASISAPDGVLLPTDTVRLKCSVWRYSLIDGFDLLAGEAQFYAESERDLVLDTFGLNDVNRWINFSLKDSRGGPLIPADPSFDWDDAYFAVALTRIDAGTEDYASPVVAYRCEFIRHTQTI